MALSGSPDDALTIERWARFDAMIAKGAAPALVATAHAIEIEAGFDRASDRRRAPRLSTLIQGAVGGVAALMLAVGALLLVENDSPPAPRLEQPAPPRSHLALVVADPPATPPASVAPAAPARSAPPPPVANIPVAPLGATAARMDEATVAAAALEPPPRQRAQASSPSRAAVGAPVSIIVRAPGGADSSETVSALRAAGYPAVRTRPATTSALTVQARYFDRRDRDAAEAILRALGSPAAPSDFTRLRPSPGRGVVEVWLPARNVVAPGAAASRG
jgi:hypothetical protein